jgi:hypothetical protein
MGLALMLLGILSAALVVGFLWGGKSWCNYFCPVGVVQRIYTQPHGLLDSRPHIKIVSLPQSMCRTPAKNGDRSACVACAPSCPDIDLEKSYWDGISDARLQNIYFGFFGLIWGFYCYFFLYSGNWAYYFSGIWTHEPNQLQQLWAPGLYINDHLIGIPKIFAVPLVLALFTAFGIALGKGILSLYQYTRMKFGLINNPETINHQALIVSAYLSINSFYFFGGRPTIALLPLPIARLIDVLIVGLTTLWLIQAWRHSSLRYKHEGLAQVFLRQLRALKADLSAFLGGRSLEELNAEEINIIAMAPGLQSEELRLSTYRDLLQEFSSAGGSPQILAKIRDAQLQLNISVAEHLALTRELQVFLPYAGTASEIVGGMGDDRIISLMGYRQALLDLLADSNHQPNPAQIEKLCSLYQVSAKEHELIMDQITIGKDDGNRLLYARLDELADFAAIHVLLRQQRGKSHEWDRIAKVYATQIDRESKQVLIRFLAALRASQGSSDAEAFASLASIYVGSAMDEVLETRLPTEPHLMWYQALQESLVICLAGGHGTDKASDNGQAKILGGLPRLHDLMADHSRAVQYLMVQIQSAPDCIAAMAYRLLLAIEPQKAKQIAQDRLSDSVQDLDFLREALNQSSTSNIHAGDMSALDKFLWLAQAPLLKGVPLERIAEIAKGCESHTYEHGAVVIREGDAPDNAIFLVDGRLSVERGGKVVGAIEAGSLTGELGLLSGQPRRATLRVSTPHAHALTLSGEELNALIERDHRVANSLLKAVASYV